jgi:predicted small lipoprotein YifL
MSRRAALIVLSALTLAACGTTGGPSYLPPAPVIPPPPPPPPGAIEGHGAFRLAQGRATCAGFSVALMPDRPRYRARFQALYGSTERVMEPVTEVKARSARLPASPDTGPIASASCDLHGEFGFPSVVGDRYFLIMHVKLKPAQVGHDDYVLLQPITVTPGQTTVVTLAP